MKKSCFGKFVYDTVNIVFGFLAFFLLFSFSPFAC